MEELQASDLGTQEYWDNRYKEEIENFADHGDPGEIWFGEDTVERIIKWMFKTKSIDRNSKILDIGCGNGMFLVELATEGFKNLYGFDYSPDAIKLAKSIAEKKELKIEYSVCNILEGFEGQFDVIHDKGTYDAISCNPNAREYRNKYIENVRKGLEGHGFFVITSCNWTKEELCEHFKSRFEYLDHISSPQFKFGGVTGSTVASLIFRAKLSQKEFKKNDIV